MSQLGSAGRSMGFLIGDWLVYGDAKVRRGEYPLVEGGIYHDAIEITGLDYNTLATYATVARKVPRSIRIEQLSFDHHRKVAPLKTDEEKQHWLQIAEKEARKQHGKPMSSRRLAKSIIAQRVVTPEEMKVPSSDRGCDNVHPHVNRLVAFWRKLGKGDWLQTTDDFFLEAMLQDLAAVVKMAEELQGELDRRRADG